MTQNILMVNERGKRKIRMWINITLIIPNRITKSKGIKKMVGNVKISITYINRFSGQYMQFISFLTHSFGGHHSARIISKITIKNDN